MTHIGVYPIKESMPCGPRQLSVVPRYRLQIPGQLPEASEAASVLLNLCQTRAEENVWVWISKYQMLTTLRQDIQAFERACIGLHLTDTYETPRYSRFDRLLDWWTNGDHSKALLEEKRKQEVPRPFALDRAGEVTFKQGLGELVHYGLAKRLVHTINGETVPFYAPTSQLVAIVERQQAQDKPTPAS